MKPLSTTSFALLAQIAREPMSAYALTQLMRRNLHYIWPRAESRIYAEVKALEAAGYLKAQKATVGRRARTMLSITPRGRKALPGSLASPVLPGVAIESDALVRVFFAAFGAVNDLRRALEQVRHDAEEMRATALEVGAAYLSGEGSAPEQIHVRALMHELLGEYSLLLTRWSESSLTAVEAWSDVGSARKVSKSRARLEATMERLSSSAARPGGATSRPGLTE